MSFDHVREHNPRTVQWTRNAAATSSIKTAELDEVKSDMQALAARTGEQIIELKSETREQLEEVVRKQEE